MDKIKLLFFLGVWTALLPYLGFPYYLKNILFSLTGVVLVYLSILLGQKIKIRSKKKEKTIDSFSENSDTSSNFEEKEETEGEETIISKS